MTLECAVSFAAGAVRASAVALITFDRAYAVASWAFLHRVCVRVFVECGICLVSIVVGIRLGGRCADQQLRVKEWKGVTQVGQSKVKLQGRQSDDAAVRSVSKQQRNPQSMPGSLYNLP